MTGPDVDRVVAGSPVMWPAVTGDGSRVLHLARSEARKKRDPALVGICTALRDIELLPARRRPWWRRWRRRRWCPDCGAYKAYLESLGRL